MRRWLFCLALFGFPSCLAAQTPARLQGTIIRMRMSDCLSPRHSFRATMSGTAALESPSPCPEYVLVSDTIVYVIIGKSSDQILPLAEVTRFRMRKNEMLIRVDDSAKESRFQIKAMVLRPEWDRNQGSAETDATALVRRNTGKAIDGSQ